MADEFNIHLCHHIFFILSPSLTLTRSGPSHCLQADMRLLALLLAIPAIIHTVHGIDAEQVQHIIDIETQRMNGVESAEEVTKGRRYCCLFRE
jgi:hypothetical protein